MIFWLIIFANIAASFKAFQDDYFFRKYEFHIQSIKSGEKFRMLTSGFLHVDIPHLAFNMITFYFFAPFLTNHLNDLGFVVIYFGSLVGGSLLSLWYHNNQSYYRAVGASGAVSGVIFATIMLFPELNLYLFFIPIPIPAYVFGIAYLLYSIYGMKNQLGNIGHSAHLGGAIAGFVLVIIQKPSLILQNTLMFVLLLVPIVVLLVMSFKQKS